MAQITITVQEVVYESQVDEYSTAEIEESVLEGVQQHGVSEVNVSGNSSTEETSISFVTEPSQDSVPFDQAERIASVGIKRYSEYVDGVDYEATLSKGNIVIDN